MPCAHRSWVRSADHRGLPILPPRYTVDRDCHGRGPRDLGQLGGGGHVPGLRKAVSRSGGGDKRPVAHGDLDRVSHRRSTAVARYGPRYRIADPRPPRDMCVRCAAGRSPYARGGPSPHAPGAKLPMTHMRAENPALLRFCPAYAVPRTRPQNIPLCRLEPSTLSRPAPEVSGPCVDGWRRPDAGPPPSDATRDDDEPGRPHRTGRAAAKTPHRPDPALHAPSLSVR